MSGEAAGEPVEEAPAEDDRDAAPRRVAPESAAPDKTMSSRIRLFGDAADALTASLKALLLLLLGVLLIGAASLIVVHDLTRHTILVAIDPRAASLLADLGSELDLPDALVDEVNLRVEGVRRIARDRLFDGLIAGDTIGELSLKTFGVDVSTGQIETWLRDALDLPAPYGARIGLVCLGGPCDATRLAALDNAASRAALTLRIEVRAGARHQTLAFPLPARNPGLRRGLRAAMRRGAEAMLESAEPLAAGIYYLSSLVNEPFQNVILADLARAAGMAAEAKAQPGAGCMADVVFADSVAIRGDPAGAGAILRAREAEADPTCKSRAATNLSVLEAAFAICMPPGANREFFFKEAAHNIEVALFAPGLVTPGLVRPGLDAARAARLRSVGVLIGLQAEFLPVMGDEARRHVCPQLATADAGSKRTAAAGGYEAMPAAIDKAARAMPPDFDDTGVHDLVARVSDDVAAASYEATPKARFRMAEAAEALANRFVAADPHPHVLFLALGRAAQEKAVAAYDLISETPETKYALLKERGVGLIDLARPDDYLGNVAITAIRVAVVAFQDADATQTASPLTEDASILEAKTRLGDALFASGQLGDAMASWQDAIDSFADLDEPHQEAVWLAKAAAHWGSVLIDTGACDRAPTALVDWNESWSRLGLASLPSPCEANVVVDDALTPLRSLITETWKACGNRAAPDPDAAAHAARRREMLRCLDTTGPSDPGHLLVFLQTPPRRLDAALARAE